MTTNGKKLSEAEAWRFLALKWEDAAERGAGDVDLDVNRGPSFGLCECIDDVDAAAMVSDKVADQMLVRIRMFDDGMASRGGRPYWWLGSEAAERATACGLLAAMADDDAKGRKR